MSGNDSSVDGIRPADGIDSTRMAYLIFADRDGEVLRLPLAAERALTVGRAEQNDAPLHDALLSRHHCRIEPLGEHWLFLDLQSRNGSFLKAERITRHLLTDGEVIRIGRTRICFRDGDLSTSNSTPPARARSARPADPIQALAGTVIGFALTELDPEEEARIADFPRPQPRAAEPRSFAGGSARALVLGLTLATWEEGTRRPGGPQIADDVIPHDDKVEPASIALTRASTSTRHTAAFALIAAIAMAALCVSIVYARR